MPKKQTKLNLATRKAMRELKCKALVKANFNPSETVLFEIMCDYGIVYGADYATKFIADSK